MGKFIDLTGQKFGRLTVIKKLEKRGKEWYWLCQCECGGERITSGKSLRSNTCRSCGCLKQESDRSPKGNVIDMTGRKFGHLTVLEREGSDHRGEALWRCRCDCELESEIIVLGSNLRTGHTQSCGCDRRSKGEKAVQQLLLDNKIPFIIEYTFDDFPKKRFDFLIKTDKEYCIEYDGETHYQYNLHGWHNEAQLIKQRKTDESKNIYCKENNISLIRIPFWHLKELKIEDLLLETSNFIVESQEKS